MIRKKPHLDAQVSRDLGIKQDVVARVTKAFLQQLAEVLSDLDEAHIDGFGKFKVGSFYKEFIARTRGKNNKILYKPQRLRMRQYRIHFQKARPIGVLLRAKHGDNITEA